MKALIVEDDFTSRLLMQKLLGQYQAESHIAINGIEAVIAFRQSLAEQAPYDLVCMDIMMPEMDGLAALKEIRTIEMGYGILPGDGAKVIMTTALRDVRSVTSAYKEFCDAYISKPIDKVKFYEELLALGLVA